MTTRARLRYFDGSNNEQVIGRISEVGGGSIDQFTLRNSGTQFSKATIVASSDLFGSFPTASSDVTAQNNASGPEIFVDVYDTVNDQWVVRDRVYAESQGVVNNDGRLKHKRLYGFEKYTGKQKVNISSETDADASPVTTNIVDALEAVLPSGYVVEAPGDVTIPSVSRYTFIGDRSKAYKELRENYGWLIWFTSETDGSGNYKVYFQPEGYGSQVDTFEKGVDPVYFDKWTKDDELRRITEAEVVGTDEAGNQYSASASTNPNDGRFLRRNVGYLQSDSEAQEIAVNLIAADSDGGSPESVEHGKITVSLDQPPANNLNASVQVINSEFNIDDLFTVVEQVDYFHQSQASYSFEFEKELTNRDQEDKKNLEERNSELISNVNKNLKGQTGEDDPDVDGDSDDTGPDVQGDTGDTGPDVQGDTGDTGPNVSGVSDAESVTINSNDNEGRSNVAISGSDWTQVSILNTAGGDALFYVYDIEIWGLSSSPNWLKIAISDDSEGQGDLIFMDTIHDPNGRTFNDPDGGINQNMVYRNTVLVPKWGSLNQTPDHYLSMTADSSVDVDFNFRIAEITHDHDAGTYDADLHPHGDGTLDAILHPHSDGTLDAVLHPHGDGTYGVVLHPHDAGSLNADVAEENKRSRG